jgi:hypothetical protein
VDAVAGQTHSLHIMKISNLGEPTDSTSLRTLIKIPQPLLHVPNRTSSAFESAREAFSKILEAKHPNKNFGLVCGMASSLLYGTSHSLSLSLSFLTGETNRLF